MESTNVNENDENLSKTINVIQRNKNVKTDITNRAEILTKDIINDPTNSTINPINPINPININRDPNLSVLCRYISSNTNDTNPNWALRDERIIRNYIQKAKGYRYLYNKTYYYYYWYHQIITIPLALSATLLTGVQVLSTALFDPENALQSQIFNIITTILTFITSTYIGFELKFNFIGKAKACKSMASDFDEYQQELHLVLSLAPDLRANPMYVINNAQIEYHKLAANDEITIPKKIIEEYVLRFKDKYALVDIADDFDDFSDTKEFYSMSLQKNNILKKFVHNIQNERYDAVMIDENNDSL
jgi:hypothetical protein